ncbi:metallophosphoesterase [Thermococcus sp. Bubb.Bath]|uniref:metallophosphoesterase n=1 Tax=Thermococcus sp. Bubb.Bath TaxID=1638242 RepID=UPI00143AF786|nr:metallophosphoesterase [Thermococcus sp. Bubb.Bath]NJF25640.1 metallophosphoesterase [Thermococcus sp. Bubb.Bath]
MKFEFLPEKALKIGNTLIVADLHVGFEEAMVSEGHYIPKLLDELISSLQGLLKKEKPKRLIIDGDLKHSFVPLKREMQELRTFFEGINGLVDEIILVRGNHDVGILWLRELGVEIVDELELSGWKVVHGHKLVRGKRFIIGHEHPAIRLRDEVGAAIKVPAFLAGEELIVLPAFSPWAYGNDVTREIVSPFLRKFDISKLRVLVPLGDEVLDFGELGKLMDALRKLSLV